MNCFNFITIATTKLFNNKNVFYIYIDIKFIIVNFKRNEVIKRGICYIFLI